MVKGKIPVRTIPVRTIPVRTTGPQPNMSRSQMLTILGWTLRTGNQGKLAAGFTLLELLVAMIVGSILTLALLFSAVQLMGTNQREGARSDTQREVQAALDYIARDLREAVYVYDGQCLNPVGGKRISASDPAQGNCRGLLNDLPPQLNNSQDRLPILAFWRVDPIPEPLVALCQTPETAKALTQKSEVRRPIDEINCGAKRMYTLVVYSLNREGSPTDPNPSNRVWGGRARITRYQLPKYTYEGSKTPTITPGWVAPDGTESSFLSWPTAGANGITRLGLVANQRPARASYWDNKVLVDFIDDPTQADIPGATVQATCPPGPQLATPGGIPPAQFVVTPDQSGSYISNLRKNIFYACVRGSGSGALNQEVLVRIQGNGAGRAGLNVKSTELPLTMETRVLTRGLIGKDT
jgi:prepilin-type N-terminal cleavage/methylation domain-containing protein